jgi:SNW domain-containing protein 1
MEALSRVVDAKLTAANPKALNANARPGGPQYIKYTPHQTNRHHNSGVDHRIIQMQEMPVDPLEPPKFRHTKVPKVPDEMPVPVLHSPPRPVTKEDQTNWKIPPCVSAWKNPKVCCKCLLEFSIMLMGGTVKWICCMNFSFEILLWALLV